jgi:hypothetical protein
MKHEIQAHGKIENNNQPTLLEQVWGYNELSKYGTLDETEYVTKLADMNRSDLENHARTLGVVVVESTARLRDKLIGEFRQYTSLLHKPAPAEHLKGGKPDAAALKILAEGR